MDLFHKAKRVRLRSHHDKYLFADDDEEHVTHDRNGTAKNTKWSVEFVDGGDALRLKSCYGKYLTASNMPFLLGMTGKKVLQTTPRRLDSSVEWEPIREGFQVRLKTRYGQYLLANGGVPPWRNQVTHDIPHIRQDWILWEVDVVEIRIENPSPSTINMPSPPPSFRQVHHDQAEPSELGSSTFPRLSRLESEDSFANSPVKNEGRIIYYTVANENSDVDDEREELSFNFNGNFVVELKEKLEEETGLSGILVCS